MKTLCGAFSIVVLVPAVLLGQATDVVSLKTPPPSDQSTTVLGVPKLVRISSSYHSANGSASSGVESATLAIYAEEAGGTALWQETQNVSVDADGHYSVLLGSTRNEGLPVELFTTGEPRWLGVQFQQRPGETEQPRVLLASVPYALKAMDANTLGGLPASAYLRTEPATGPSEPAAAKSGSGATKAPLPRVTSGTPNSIVKFVTPTDIGNSVMFENAGKVGLGTAGPLDYFHVAFNDTTGGFTGYAVQNLGGGANSYSGMLFYDQNGALGAFHGLSNYNHEYRVNSVGLNGSINLMLNSSSKFLVRSDGDVDVPGSIRKFGRLFLHMPAGPYFGNTGVGLDSLVHNTSRTANTALGDSALGGNTTGFANTASGAYALAGNATGINNTASGYEVLMTNNTGENNTASGYQTLFYNTTGNDNTASGFHALFSNTTGYNNTASGDSALERNTTGNQNTALGFQAGVLVTTGSNNIMIGNNGTPTDNGVIRIGASGTHTSFFAAGISGVSVAGVPVMVDSNGQLGVAAVSSRRYKEDIQDMGNTSSDLLRLRPVTYRYKQPYADGSKPLDYGLIAEEVAEVYPDLVVRNKEGQVETVQYQKLTPMLLNELQKQNRNAQQQDLTIRQQHREIESLKAKLAGMSALEARLTALEALLSRKVAATATAGQ